MMTLEKSYRFMRFLTTPPNPSSAEPSNTIVDGSGILVGVPTSLAVPLSVGTFWNRTKIALQI